MKKLLVSTVAVVAISAAMIQSSHSTTVCSSRTTFLEELGAQHREHPIAMGLAANGSVLEVLASQEGTWTILITSPNGTSCVIAVGDSWEALKVKKVNLDPAA